MTADTPVLQAGRATLGQLVDQRRIVELPLNGRTFMALVALAPGVALPPGSQLPRINGGRPRVNEYLYDGISVLQPEPGQVAFFPVIDAIQEFKIESNSPPAEFGRFNGGVINLAMKSGSNASHGLIRSAITPPATSRTSSCRRCCGSCRWARGVARARPACWARS